jgi:DNA (cytosine-5)-methyltransferase 1
MSKIIPAGALMKISTKADNTFEKYLDAARKTHPEMDLAKRLGTTERTLRRWKSGEVSAPLLAVEELQRVLNFEVRHNANSKFKFIDLFAGIGGIRAAFEAIGGECVFTSEWDAYAQKTYAANFPSTHAINGDITQIHEADIPDHDVLLGGFPCQPFSIAGVSKKNALGRAHGFSDETQGTLFFDVARIISEKRPKAFLLENVKNLQSHDKGRTFQVILKTLQEELGYHVFFKVIDGAHFVPQHRERILIVGFRDPVEFDWNGLGLPEKGERKLGDVLHQKSNEPFIQADGDRYYDHKAKKVLDKYTLTDNLWTYLQNYKKKHQEAGNGFGFGLVNKDSVTRTLSARYYKDGSEILLSQGSKKNPRRLTPRECARLMGFPDTFKIPVSDTRAYKQFGNSVIVPVMQYVAELMKENIMASQQRVQKPRMKA